MQGCIDSQCISLALVCTSGAGSISHGAALTQPECGLERCQPAPCNCWTVTVMCCPCWQSAVLRSPPLSKSSGWRAAYELCLQGGRGVPACMQGVRDEQQAVGCMQNFLERCCLCLAYAARLLSCIDFCCHHCSCRSSALHCCYCLCRGNIAMGNADGNSSFLCVRHATGATATCCCCKKGTPIFSKSHKSDDSITMSAVSCTCRALLGGPACTRSGSCCSSSQ